MVHPQAAWCESLDDVLHVFKGGDVLTHCYHEMATGILDEKGQVRDSVHAAMERGVIMDVGHGAGSFSWKVVEAALEQGVLPQTISSDLHVYNVNGPVYDLANVITKFLYLGMSLDDALARVTSVPARDVLHDERLGTLAPGTCGDAVVFELRQGEFNLEDSRFASRTGSQKLEPLTVIKGGRVYQS